MNNQSKIIASLVLILITFVSGGYIWSAIGIGISLYYFLKVIDNMGDKIPIIDLMTALAALQWIVGPYIDYHNKITHYKYYMYVDEATYMSFVVPNE
jgi:hypothetical protein